jgi:hypothetical protein
VQQVPRALDGVIRREPGVRERGRVDGIEVAEWDEPPGVRHEHQGGHAPVEAEAAAGAIELGRPLAIVLCAEMAPPAPPTSPRSVHGDGFTGRQVVDAGAHRLDESRVLVAQGERQGEGQ